MISGASTIPISNVSWQATPNPPFQERHAQHDCADAGDGHGVLLDVQRGDVTFRFVNSWNYTVSNYTQTADLYVEFTMIIWPAPVRPLTVARFAIAASFGVSPCRPRRSQWRCRRFASSSSPDPAAPRRSP